jgi:hypothetical protein
MHFNLVQLASYAVMLVLFWHALAHWFAWREMRHRIRDNGKLLQLVFAEQAATGTANECFAKLRVAFRSDGESLKRHPLGRTIAWVLVNPARVPQRARVLERFEIQVRSQFKDLIHEADHIKNLGPACGLFFTFAGIVMAASHFAAGSGPAGLLGDIGAAMVASTMGVFIMIAERALVEGRVLPFAESIYLEGSLTLDDLLDRLTVICPAIPRRAERDGQQ